MRKRIRPEKIVFYGVISGIVGPSIMGIGMLVSALSYVGSEGQRYSILNHFVSELGELGVSDLAWVFNGSLFIGGLLTTFFMVVLAYQITSWVRYPLGLLSVIATLCGALVGVYPMNNLDMHTFVAMTFFNLGMLISFLYSVVFLFGKNYIFPKYFILLNITK